MVMMDKTYTFIKMIQTQNLLILGEDNKITLDDWLFWLVWKAEKNHKMSRKID